MTTRNPGSLISVAGAVSAFLYLTLAMHSRQYGDASLLHSALVYGTCALLAFGVAAILQRLPEIESSGRRTLILIMTGAVLFRLLGVLTFPVLEDDFYRYLWDGRAVIETGQPYGVAPARWFGDDALDDKFSAILDGINYPEVATVYGPTLQWLFAASYLIAPGEVWPLQVMSALADIGVLLVLLKLCAGRWSLLIGGCLLYAWSPLLIKEFATTAHPDVVGVLFVSLALFGYCRGRWFLVGLCLGIATGVKPFALLVAPFLLGFRVRALLGFCVAVVLVSLPFLLNGPAPGVPAQMLSIWLPEGLRMMGDSWLFNAPLYLLVDSLAHRVSGGAFDIAYLKTSLLSGFAVLWLWQLLVWLGREHSASPTAVRNIDEPKATFDHQLERLGQLPHRWLFGVFLLVLPVLNPWYLVWWLPFVVLRPRGRQWLTPWVASVAVGLSYGSGINLEGGGGLYDIPGWLVVVEFGVIGCALAWDAFFGGESYFSCRR